MVDREDTETNLLCKWIVKVMEQVSLISKSLLNMGWLGLTHKEEELGGGVVLGLIYVQETPRHY